MLIIALFISSLLLIGCTADSHPRSPKVSIAYLWSLSSDRSVAVREDCYIEGRVVLTDKFGEVQQVAVIADASGCIELKIDSRNVERLLPVDALVRVRCSGLCVGREGRKVVLGAPPTSEYVVDRIAETEVYNYVEIVDMWDMSDYAVSVAIGAVGEDDIMQYVDIDGVWFVGADEGVRWCDCDADGEFTQSLRRLTDGRDTLRVVVGAATEYAADMLPRGTLRCRGVVEWYRDSVALRIAHRHVTPINE